MSVRIVGGGSIGKFWVMYLIVLNSDPLELM